MPSLTSASFPVEAQTVCREDREKEKKRGCPMDSTTTSALVSGEGTGHAFPDSLPIALQQHPIIWGNMASCSNQHC